MSYFVCHEGSEVSRKTEVNDPIPPPKTAIFWIAIFILLEFDKFNVGKLPIVVHIERAQRVFCDGRRADQSRRHKLAGSVRNIHTGGSNILVFKENLINRANISIRPMFNYGKLKNRSDLFKIRDGMIRL